VHWLSLASKLSRALAGAGRPVTIRGHSFDFAPRVVEKLASHGAVRRVYLFPHLAAQPRPRRLLRGRGRLDVLPAVRSLPCTYASRRYLPPASGKDRTLVFRATAGLPTKDLSSFIRVAAACPGFRFVLAMTISPNFPRLRGQLLRQVERAKAPVEIRFNLQHEEVAELTGRAGICLRSHDPRAHVYGMPISVAEAMATGSYVVARDDPAARAFLGGAGAFFRRDEEAAALINATLRWSDADWDREAAAARDRAAAYRDDAVLPAVVHDWRSLVGESAA
jgi:hypothetical protein